MDISTSSFNFKFQFQVPNSSSKFKFKFQVQIRFMFKFLFKSKFLGFVEAPVSVFHILSGVACVWIVWSSSCSFPLSDKPHSLYSYIRGCLMLVPAGFTIPCTRSFNKFLALIHLVWVCSLPVFLQVINRTKCVVTHMTFKLGLFTVYIPAIFSKMAISAADIPAFYVLRMMFFLMLHQLF